MTEIEYDTAQEMKTSTLVYVIDEDQHSIVPADMDTGISRDLLIKFRNRVLKNHVCSFFISPQDLAVKVSVDLVRCIASLKIKHEIDDIYKKQKVLPKLIAQGGYGSDLNDMPVDLADKTEIKSNSIVFNNQQFSYSVTALHLATQISEGNLNALKGFMTFDKTTWRVLVVLLEQFEVSHEYFNNAILATTDIDLLRILVSLVGELCLLPCADAVCQTARFANKREVIEATQKYKYVATPFFTTISYTLSRIANSNFDILRFHLLEAKKNKQWQAYNAIKKSMKQKHVEQQH